MLEALPGSENVQAYFEAIVRGLDSPLFTDLGPSARYDVLETMYLGNGAYETPGTEPDDPVIRPIRNPTMRAVEFYADTLWSGKPRVSIPNPRLISPVKSLLEWSNWPVRKQQFARWFSLYGDGFLKIEQRPDGRPYIRLLKPRFVTEFDVDERGYITYFRMDVDFEEMDRSTREITQFTYTEIWEKGRVRTWKKKRASGIRSLKELGTPDTDNSNLTFDFIPIVHAPFKLFDDKYGQSCVMSALDKIHEANRQATMQSIRMYRYNQPDLVLEGAGTDALGRPLPPPVVDSEGSLSTDTVMLGDERLWRLPAGWHIGHIVAPLNYAASLALLESQMTELAQDMPELAYGKMFELGSDSGKAIRYKLFPAISRAKEGRANGETAIIRAVQMALTIGQDSGIWSGLGSYDSQDFDMAFIERDVIPLSIEEKQTILMNYINSRIPIRLALQWSGHTDEQIAEFDAAVSGGNAELNAAIDAYLDSLDNPPASSGSTNP